MYYLEKKLRLNDLLPTGEMSPNALLLLMHATADEQMTCEGASNEDVLSAGHGFILSSLTIEISKRMAEHDTVRVYSWPCPSHGYTFIRCYKAEVNGVETARGMTRWALVDRVTHKLLPIERAGIESYTLHDPIEIGSTGRVTFPKGIELEKVGEHKVGYTETDYNGHMNNVRYIELLLDHIGGLDDRSIRSLDIRYRGEAPLGETIEISRVTDGNDVYFSSTCAGHPNIDAKIALVKTNERQ